MEIRSKIWLEIDGETVFGSGRRALLENIEQHGSINKAAHAISISYRKALSYIQAMESRIGVRLVERKTGGKNGGGAVLTKEARELLGKYSLLEEGISEFVDKRFSAVFRAGRDCRDLRKPRR